tara:strand:+ start:1093 stop:1335 length:243 start_codon:yes stop_codon:yes gene_type:complete
MSRDDPQFKLRLPAALHEQIKEASEQNHRSMNAEMVARLAASFEQRGLSIDSIKAADEMKIQDAIEVLSKAKELLKRIDK